MPTTQQILSYEETNTNQILLIKEGNFWRAYEQSAYLFKNHFYPDIKVNSRYIKAVKQNLHNIGFPLGSLRARLIDKLPEIKGAVLKSQNENRIVVEVPPIEGFGEWAKSLSMLKDQTDHIMQPFYGEKPLYKAVYDLFFQLVSVTRHFQKDVKFALGDKIIDIGITLNAELYRLMNTAQSKTKERQLDADFQKQITFNEMLEKTDTLRFLLRTSYDLHLYGMDKFVDLSEKIESVRKQLYGWARTDNDQTKNNLFD